MNRLFLVIILAFALSQAAAVPGSVSIKGTITNRLSDTVSFSYVTYGGNWLDYEKHMIVEVLDKEGNFHATLPFEDEYEEIRIENGREVTEVFACPGDKLILTVDAANFDATLKYEGIGMKAAVANFAAKHTRQFGLSESIYLAIRDVTLKEESDFLKGLDSVISGEQRFLADNSNGLPESFIKYWHNTYEYFKYNAILQYPYMHDALYNRNYSHDKITTAQLAVTKRVPEKFDDALMNVSSYRQYLGNLYPIRLASEGITNSPDAPYSKDDGILKRANEKMSKASAEYVYAEHMKQQMKGQPLERAEQLYSTFTRQYPASRYTQSIEKLLVVRRRLNPGSPAIDFTVKDADGKTLKISDLKGKVVYLDFWASWCGPCKKEFAHAKTIREHFSNRDVVFVYISLDENIEAWAKAVADYKLPGLHTREEGGFKAILAQEYGITIIPSYFLIDKEGNFAIENPPRPSKTEELIKAIEELL